ncbi:unnamed protein product [Brassica napus]|uniref:(rape) hypothetical protein n=1 Tax=Brassica napus TaxID=3708 RepID=A0A816TWY2_BRANA|nr:unnamed protein product [Brassica napus]
MVQGETDWAPPIDFGPNKVTAHRENKRFLNIRFHRGAVVSERHGCRREDGAEALQHDDSSRRKEGFDPFTPGKVGLYVCAYDFSHMGGHARADVLYRSRSMISILPPSLIIIRANESGEKPLELSNRFCEEYLASDHMDHIINMIKIKRYVLIIEKDCGGYVVEVHVFFFVDKSLNYGKLSGQLLEHTRNPADFALWKAANPDEPSWEGPRGPGKTSKQSDKYWLHNGHLTINNEKMAKSKKNFKTIRQQWLKKTVEKLNRLQKPKTSSKSEFEATMLDYLNTLPIYSLTGAYQDALKSSIGKLKKTQKTQLVSLVEVEKAAREVLDVLGLLTTLSYAENTNKSRVERRRHCTEDIEEKKKEFEKSDQIRAVQGISVMDIGKETVWRPMLPFYG